MLTRSAFDTWLAAYFNAWRSNDGGAVERLFATDAVYHYGPFTEPARGRTRIVANWIAEGPPAEVRSRYEIEAVEGEVGVAHWWVRQRGRAEDDPVEFDGILVIRFDRTVAAPSTGSGSCDVESFDRPRTPGRARPVSQPQRRP